MSERRARRRRSSAPAASHERWLVSYADFITLLFAFFTTMYAISTVDAQKLSHMVDSMQIAFDRAGPSAVGRGEAAGASTVAAAPRPLGPTEALAERLRAKLGDRGVEVATDRRGVVVSLRESGSFATGSAELSAEARRVLADLAATIKAEGDVFLRVEGHTDDVPIQTGRYASNWELSTARATTVVTYLLQDAGLAPERLSAAGYGEFHPRAPNTSPENRARNRRVDVVILRPETIASEEPPAL